MKFIYLGIGKFLGLLDGVFGNYMIALLVFGVLVELLLLPFGIKQQKNSIKQAGLRPKEMAIRKKYAGRNDQQTQKKLQEEIQDLYTREGYNPASGCLPLLLQLIIVIILYKVVYDPLQYVLGMSATTVKGLAEFAASEFGVNTTRGTIELISKIREVGVSAFEGLKTFAYSDAAMSGEAVFNEFAEIIGDGSNLPNFTLFGLNLGLTPDVKQFGVLWLVPVLTFVIYFFSMKLTRKFSYQPQMTADSRQQGCSNNIMDISMPLMSAYFAFIWPAAIGVYWVFKSILSTLKQFILSKVMPLPTFTEEEIKAAEKELKQASKGNAPTRSYSSNGEKPRSYHHIDDDDEDYSASSVSTHKGTRYDNDEVTDPIKRPTETSDKVDAAPMKDESDKPNHEEKKDNE